MKTANKLCIYRDADYNTYLTEGRGNLVVIAKYDFQGNCVDTIGHVFRKRSTAENSLFELACANGWRMCGRQDG